MRRGLICTAPEYLVTPDGNKYTEPCLAEMMDMFGFKTAILPADTPENKNCWSGGFQPTNGNGSSLITSGEEEIFQAIQVIDPTKPITISGLVSYHHCCKERLAFYWSDTATGYGWDAKWHKLFQHKNMEVQTVLPVDDDGSFFRADVSATAGQILALRVDYVFRFVVACSDIV